MSVYKNKLQPRKQHVLWEVDIYVAIHENKKSAYNNYTNSMLITVDNGANK